MSKLEQEFESAHVVMELMAKAHSSEETEAIIEAAISGKILSDLAMFKLARDLNQIHKNSPFSFSESMTDDQFKDSLKPAVCAVTENRVTKILNDAIDAYDSISDKTIDIVADKKAASLMGKTYAEIEKETKANQQVNNIIRGNFHA